MRTLSVVCVLYLVFNHLFQDTRKIYTNCECSNVDLVPGPCPAEDICSTKKWIVFIIQKVVFGILMIVNFPATSVAYLR